MAAKSSTHKKCTIVFNSFVLIIGLLLLILSTWSIFDGDINGSLSMMDEDSTLLFSAMGIGALVTLVAICGIVGTAKDNFCMLTTFAALVFVLMLGQVAFGVILYATRLDSRDTIRKSVNLAISGEQVGKSEEFRDLEQSMECCGSFGYQSWSQSRSNLVHTAGFEPGQGIYFVDKSCCVHPDSPECKTVTLNGLDKMDTVPRTEFHSQGCTEKIVTFVLNYINLVFVFGTVVIATEVIAIVFTTRFILIIRNSI